MRTLLVVHMPTCIPVRQVIPLWSIAGNSSVLVFSEHSPSPLGRWLDCMILAVERGMLEVELFVRPGLMNPDGTFHGGVIAALMDDVIGTTIFMLGKKNFFTSVNLVVDYFASATKMTAFLR